MDALVGDGGPFEFKAVELLAPRHRRQLYNYLLMLDLAHGKLANLRTESVQHEFVNAKLRPDERCRFKVVSDHWNGSIPGSDFLLESLVSVLKDWERGSKSACTNPPSRISSAGMTRSSGTCRCMGVVDLWDRNGCGLQPRKWLSK